MSNTINYKEKRSALDYADCPEWTKDWGFENNDDPARTIIRDGKINGSGC